MSQVRNSMETKLGQSFQLSEVRNKSELLQKHIHTMQTNLQFIVTLVEGYVYMWLSALKQSCVNEQIIWILSNSAIFVCQYIVDEIKSILSKLSLTLSDVSMRHLNAF